LGPKFAYNADVVMISSSSNDHSTYGNINIYERIIKAMTADAGKTQTEFLKTWSDAQSERAAKDLKPHQTYVGTTSIYASRPRRHKSDSIHELIFPSRKIKRALFVLMENHYNTYFVKTVRAMLIAKGWTVSILRFRTNEEIAERGSTGRGPGRRTRIAPGKDPRTFDNLDHDGYINWDTAQQDVQKGLDKLYDPTKDAIRDPTVSIFWLTHGTEDNPFYGKEKVRTQIRQFFKRLPRGARGTLYMNTCHCGNPLNLPTMITISSTSYPIARRYPRFDWRKRARGG